MGGIQGAEFIADGRSQPQRSDYPQCRFPACDVLVAAQSKHGNNGHHCFQSNKELGKAKSTILLQTYSFTSSAIAKALVDAHKQGRSENNGKNQS